MLPLHSAQSPLASSSSQPFPLPWVAKCQSFYAEQNIQTQFYLKKNAKIAIVLVLKLNKTNRKDTLGEQVLITISNKGRLHVFQKFYPNMPIFYTDISVTFFNSAPSPPVSGLHRFFPPTGMNQTWQSHLS